MNNAAGTLFADETTVMIVSAHGHLKSHYAGILQGLGVKLIVVSDAFEALNTLRSHSVHAILADFILPGMCAIELFLVLKGLHHYVPVVICSAEFNARFRDEALMIGVFRIVRTPTRKRDIRTAIQLAIEERERQVLQFFC